MGSIGVFGLVGVVGFIGMIVSAFVPVIAENLVFAFAVIAMTSMLAIALVLAATEWLYD